jgi:uncharacterized protein (TIGR00297 family)
MVGCGLRAEVGRGEGTALASSLLGALEGLPGALVAATLLSAVAWRVGALSADGAVAGAAVGFAVILTGGWSWAGLLLAFVVAGSLASRLPPAAGPPRRTTRQVLANGTVAALAALAHPAAWAAPGFAGAVAAAWADTWSSEFGTRYGGPPRRVVGLQPVDPGTSGGVTALGSAAGVAAAALCGLLAAAFGIAPVPSTAAAGVLGALADSLLGATVQAAFRCTRCGRRGETPRCACGARGELERGLRWLDNDAVNLLATAVGALAAVALHR